VRWLTSKPADRLNVFAFVGFDSSQAVDDVLNANVSPPKSLTCFYDLTTTSTIAWISWLPPSPGTEGTFSTSQLANGPYAILVSSTNRPYPSAPLPPRTPAWTSPRSSCPHFEHWANSKHSQRLRSSRLRFTSNCSCTLPSFGLLLWVIALRCAV
jgi:hypothetical protein